MLRGLIDLFLASLVTLYFELLTIRYLSTEVRAFTNLKNLPLVASFFGIGLGMMLGKPGRALRYAFPITALFVFLPIRYASLLHLTAVDLTWNYGVAQGAAASFGLRALYAIRFLTIVLAFLALVVVFFAVLGGFVGDCLKRAPPLRAYGINLAGSLVGMALFSVLAFFNSRPALWLLVGFALLVPFFVRDRLSILLLALVLAAVAVPEPNTLCGRHTTESISTGCCHKMVGPTGPSTLWWPTTLGIKVSSIFRRVLWVRRLRPILLFFLSTNCHTCWCPPLTVCSSWGRARVTTLRLLCVTAPNTWTLWKSTPKSCVWADNTTPSIPTARLGSQPMSMMPARISEKYREKVRPGRLRSS